MKWSLDLGIAVGLTVLVWTAFYLAFPSEPFSAAETAFVLAVLYGLVKLCRWAWTRWGVKPKAGVEPK
jgi:hypothetical protein